MPAPSTAIRNIRIARRVRPLGLGLQPMARSHHRMRRMVCAPAPAGLLRFAFEFAGLVDRLLRIGPALQLSPLHGDDLSRLSHRGRFSEISDFHRPYHRPRRADHDSVALLVQRDSMDFYALPHLEPLALQRTELWPVHDVRPARRSHSIHRRPARFVLGISHFLPDFISEFHDRPVERSLVHLARNSRADQLCCSPVAGGGVHRVFDLRLVRTRKTVGLAQPAAGSDAILHAMPVVSLADCVIDRRRPAAPAEPLQQRSVCRHALGPVHLDYQLLCSP